MNNRIMIAFFLSIMFLTTSVLASNTYQVSINPLISGSSQPNTNFNYVFNWTSDYSCSNVLLSNSVSITTDSRGIGYAELNLSGLISPPSFLCEYRDGSLRKVHNISSSFYDNIYSHGDMYMQQDKKIYFNYPVSLNHYITYDSLNDWIVIGGNLKLNGTSFTMNGESTIIGGEIGSDSIRLVGSTQEPFPYVGVEGNNAINMVLNSSDTFDVVDNLLVQTNLFQVDSLGNATVHSNLGVGEKITSVGDIRTYNNFVLYGSGTPALTSKNGFLRIKPSETNVYPFLDISQNSYATWVLNESSQYFSIQNADVTPTVLFQVDGAGDGGIEHDFDIGNDLSVDNNIEGKHNITAGEYFKGDGSLLTGISSYNSTYDSIQTYWNRTGNKLIPKTAGDNVSAYYFIGNFSTAKYIPFTNNEWITFGSGTFAYVYDSANSRISSSHSSSGSATGQFRLRFRLPEDFKSFPSSAFTIDTWRTGSCTSLTATVEKNGVKDSTINAVSIYPTASDTWESKSTSFGSSYSAGDFITITIEADSGSGVFTSGEQRIDKFSIKYNSIQEGV
jgi:hypothetical protein